MPVEGFTLCSRVERGPGQQSSSFKGIAQPDVITLLMAVQVTNQLGRCPCPEDGKSAELHIDNPAGVLTVSMAVAVWEWPRRCPYHAAGAEWSYLQRRHPQLYSGGCALSSQVDVHGRWWHREPINQLAFSMLWILAQMLHLKGSGWVSLPSEDCCTLGCLLKTRAGFLTLPTACIGLWLGDAPRIQVDSLSLWITTGLPAPPEDHSRIDHLTQGESGRCFVGLGLQWYPQVVSSEALSGFSLNGSCPVLFAVPHLPGSCGTLTAFRTDWRRRLLHCWNSKGSDKPAFQCADPALYPVPSELTRFHSSFLKLFKRKLQCPVAQTGFLGIMFNSSL